jgi:flagellar biosynthesis protein FlhG
MRLDVSRRAGELSRRGEEQRVHTSSEGFVSPIISVGGGKGGVGKSLIASNLAVAFSQLGRQVVLADLDLGAANQHLLLGVARPRPGVQALLEGTPDDLRQALTPTSIPNVSLLAGTGAVLGAADITDEQKRHLLRQLRSLKAVVVLDVGAGIGYNALDFFLLGAHKLLVTTPQVTAIHDAYAFLKSAVLRTLQHSAQRAIESALLEPALLSGESARVVDILARLRVQKPELADKVYELLQRFGACLIGNQVTSAAPSGVFHSVSKMMREYLGIDVPILGHLRFSARMHDSVNDRRPVALASGEEARTFRAMGETLLSASAGVILGDDDLEDHTDPEPVRTGTGKISVIRTGERPALPGLVPAVARSHVR